MKLLPDIPKPTREEFAEIDKILSHAARPVCFADIAVNRPDHYIASWRAVVLWIMNRKRGVRQRTLANWFGMRTESVNRRVCDLDKMIFSRKPSFAETRGIIDKIISNMEVIP